MILDGERIIGTVDRLGDKKKRKEKKKAWYVEVKKKAFV